MIPLQAPRTAAVTADQQGLTVCVLQLLVHLSMVTLELHQTNDPTAGPKNSSCHGWPARPDCVRAAAAGASKHQPKHHTGHNQTLEQIHCRAIQKRFLPMRLCSNKILSKNCGAVPLNIICHRSWHRHSLDSILCKSPSRQSDCQEKCKNVVQFFPSGLQLNSWMQRSARCCSSGWQEKQCHPAVPLLHHCKTHFLQPGSWKDAGSRTGLPRKILQHGLQVTEADSRSQLAQQYKHLCHCK